MATTLNTTSVVFNDATTQETAAYMGANNCLHENNQTISANYTIATNRNAFSVGLSHSVTVQLSLFRLAPYG